MPTTIFHDDVQLSDAKEIATTFNTYFADIGKKLSANINDNDNTFNDFQQYLDTPAETSLKFNCITENETMKAVTSNIMNISVLLCIVIFVISLCILIELN